jgi:hypothetical protein
MNILEIAKIALLEFGIMIPVVYAPFLRIISGVLKFSGPDSILQR